MQEFFQTISGPLTTIFVVGSMLNVGLTQKPQKLAHHLKHWRFLTRMLLVNFLVVPGLMLFALNLVPLAADQAIALLVFSMAAGAPLLIKLTAASKNDIAQGASVMMVLMVGTIIYMPIMLPLLLDGVSVSAWSIAQPLLVQMLLPLVIGMILTQVAEGFAGVIQPWVAKIGNLALYGMLFATVLGHLGALTNPDLWVAILTAVVVLLVAFVIGHGLGDASDSMSDLGGLGTAQRNTAAAMVTASTAFADRPAVAVTAVLVNTVVMFILIPIAKQLGSGASFSWLEPIPADPPKGSPEAENRARSEQEENSGARAD